MAAAHPEFTVSSLTAALKRTIEGGFSKVVVEGEVSGWKRYPSGHCYFTLKDEGAQVSAVMFAGPYESCLARHPELADGLKDGAKVKVYGNVTVYPPRGNYQIVVLSATLAGLGDLMQRYMALKSKLEGEGLFDPTRKRPIPFMPRRIGIVTSEAGAVIHDMCTVLTRRFPNLEIRLFPAQVQGADAPKTIIAGIEYFNSEDSGFRPDLLIVARGGGSFEDLFCFNDEALARAVAASEVPVISAVGHETDFTISDFAADLRAPTPSAAAELAVPDSSVLARRLRDSERRMAGSLSSRLDYLEARLAAAANAPVLRSPGRYIDLLTDELMSLASRNDAAAAAVIEAAGSKLRVGAAKLEAMSPLAVLVRGYSAVTKDGRVVQSAACLRPGDAVKIRMSDGSADAVITDTGMPEHA